MLAAAIFVGASMCIPLVYLLLRALEAEPETLLKIVFRERNFWLLVNTLSLAALVIVITTLIAMPLAWLVVHSDLRHKKTLAFLGVLPLAVPGYVMAYALIGLSGYNGFASTMFGVRLPRSDGLWGAGLALSLYTFPYLFLNLRAAMMGMDPALEESARSLGRSRWNAFFSITLPHLWPALAAGWLVIGLYVLGDFGVIALMRYEVFSYAIYTQYASAFDRVHAAWLALMLMGVTLCFIVMEGWLSRRGRYARVGTGVARQPSPAKLGRWRPLAWLFLTLVYGASLGLPALILAYWLNLSPASLDWANLRQVFLRSVLAAAPAAVLAAILALPVVYLTVRYSSRLASVLARLVYLGYAIPPLAFALAMVFMALNVMPWAYQTLGLLILAYTLSFLALTVGPLRSSLLQMGSRTEEAARSVGYKQWQAFYGVTLPGLRRSIVAGALLVFIMVVKELPITFLLAPTGYTTLATRVFAHTSEGMLYEAAPYAALLVVFSSLFVGLIMRYEGRR